MFELPFSTTLLVLGFPLFWIAYTLVFLVLSRKWGRTARGPGDDS